MFPRKKYKTFQLLNIMVFAIESCITLKDVLIQLAMYTILLNNKSNLVLYSEMH